MLVYYILYAEHVCVSFSLLLFSVCNTIFGLVILSCIVVPMLCGIKQSASKYANPQLVTGVKVVYIWPRCGQNRHLHTCLVNRRMPFTMYRLLRTGFNTDLFYCFGAVVLLASLAYIIT